MALKFYDSKAAALAGGAPMIKAMRRGEAPGKGDEKADDGLDRIVAKAKGPTLPTKAKLREQAQREVREKREEEAEFAKKAQAEEAEFARRREMQAAAKAAKAARAAKKKSAEASAKPRDDMEA